MLPTPRLYPTPTTGINQKRTSELNHSSDLKNFDTSVPFVRLHDRLDEIEFVRLFGAFESDVGEIKSVRMAKTAATARLASTCARCNSRMIAGITEPRVLDWSDEK